MSVVVSYRIVTVVLYHPGEEEQVLGKYLNENNENETSCRDMFSRLVIMTMKTVRLEDENAKLKSENQHLQQKVALNMFHKLK